MRPILLLVLCYCLAQAQPGCPPVQFQDAITAVGAPSSSSHVVAARAPDGSYTAYEVTNASPYRIIRTTPNYAATLDACLTHRGSGPPIVPASANFGNTPGATSQASAYAILPSGNFLSVTTNGSAGLDDAEFDPSLQLVSENVYAQMFSSILLVDLNGDGNLDLLGVVNAGGLNGAVANGAIAVMMGNGGTGFQAPQMVPIGSPGVQAMAAGDFNGDRKLDLAVASFDYFSSGGRFSILLGNGDGTFQAERVPFPGMMASAVAVGDLNGDGKADLVFTTPSDDSPQVMTVALGNGDGTFGAGTQYTVGGTGAVAIGDVNGDGKPDIIAAGADLSILFGDGKGSFPKRRDYFVNLSPVLLADFDGDGILDIVGASGNPFVFGAFHTLTVLFGQGDGKFSGIPAALVPGASNPDNFGLAIAGADFNNDGNPDLAVADLAGKITILDGTGDGGFQANFQYDIQANFSGFPVAMISQDFNHDGNSDLAALVDRGPGQPGYLVVFLGLGDGTFADPRPFPLQAGVIDLAAADFDGDGNLDLGVTISAYYGGSQDAVLIQQGDGRGNFALKQSYPAGPTPFAVVAGDFNGDGKLDLAITNQGASSTAQNANVSLLLGNGDGTFQAGTAIPISSGGHFGPYTMVAADLNHDGKLDLALTLSNDTTAPGGLAVLLGKGDGTFQPPAIYSVTSAGVIVTDINGDGIPDLIMSTPRGSDAYAGIGYMLGNGDGTFQPEVAISEDQTDPGEMGPMVAADFNHDGKMDLAALSLPFGVAILLNVSQPQPAFTIVSAASLAPGPVAPESLVTAFGNNLSAGTASMQAPPLPFMLAGTCVSVTDEAGAGQPAPLLYVSRQQINFEIPSGAGTGTRKVTIAGPNGTSQTAPVTIQPVAPSLFTLNAAGLAAASVVSISHGVETTGNVYSIQQGAIVAAPVSLAADSVYLVLYGTGIRGAGGAITVNIQGVEVPVTFAGPKPDFPGLDQVNVLLPPSLAGSGSVGIVLSASGIASNTAYVSIQ